MSEKGKRVIHKYKEDALVKALNDIRGNVCSVRAASVKYGVPRTTLHDRLSGRIAEGPRKMGPETVLSNAEEIRLVQWCIDLAKCGFPKKKDDLLNTVQNILKEDGRKNPFKDDRPGKKWYQSFLRRHPELSCRIAESVTKGRAIVTEELIRKWFRDLQDYLKEVGAESILEDPNRVFNGDETSFSLSPKTGTVIAPKGWRNVYSTHLGNEKETITVLLVFSAAGKTAVPMVVFPYIRPPKAVIDSMPSDWILGRSESGWMRSETFFEYVANGFNNWITSTNTQKPVILFVDGHKSHLTMELSVFCSNNGIILYALPPNTTHIMQPADVSVFKPLKSDWKVTVHNWQAQHPNCVLTKQWFCPVLEDVLKSNNLPTSIRNGFRKCGLYPFDPNAVDYTQCIANAIENLQNLDPIPQFTPNQFNDAKNVIEFLAPRLQQQGINADRILAEIANAASSIFIPANVSTRTETMVEIISVTNVEPGSYTVNVDGNLLINRNEPVMSQQPQSLAVLAKNALILSADVCLAESLTPSTLALVNKMEVPQNSIMTTPISKRRLTFVSPSFGKHLYHPKPIQPSTSNGSRPYKARAPSAVSSEKWRDFYQNIAQKKEDKASEILKRKAERIMKKKPKPTKRKKRETCANCEEELVSDVEDDTFKNIGCDNCPRWYHLMCTIYYNLSYAEAAEKDFHCELC